MTSEKLNTLIEREKKKLEGFKAKRAEYDSKVKESEARLHQYEMMANSQKFAAVSAVVAESGLSLEAVIAALQSGDLLTLQEKMEAAQNDKDQSADAAAVEAEAE